MSVNERVFSKSERCSICSGRQSYRCASSSRV
jgi:hypothetical protein